MLLKPPFQTDTLLLWVTPIVVLLAGAAFAITRARTQKTSEATALSEAEQQTLSRLEAEAKSDATPLTKA